MERSFKLYSQRSIAWATYLGGPLAAGILIRQNCINLNNKRQGQNSLFIGIISTILIFIGIFMIPENILDSIPNILIPAIYTGIIYFIVEGIQGQKLKEHKEFNGEFYSGWKTTGIGFVCLLILLGGIFAYDYELEYTYNFNASKFEQNIIEFQKNESKALKVFDQFETMNIHHLIIELNEGRVLWETNLEITDQIDNIENLPEDLKNRNLLLLEYCSLRIIQYDFIIRSITENTHAYDQRINEVSADIENKITELSHLLAKTMHKQNTAN